MHGTRVWRKFERVINNQLVKFKIQEMPSTLNEESLKMMGKNFIGSGEIYSEGARMKHNPEDVMHMYNLWRSYVIPQKLAVVCLKDEETNLSPEIIGVNYLILAQKQNKEFHLPDKPETFLRIYKYVEAQCNIYDKFNVDKYLTAFGLCVNETYRGQGIATEILLSRDEICKKLGLKVTSTQFSGPVSQMSAEKAGFKTIKEIKFSQMEKDLNLKFPEGSDVTKVMAKIIQ